MHFPTYVEQVQKLNNIDSVYTEEGGDAHGWVHVDDPMEAYVRLVEIAASGGVLADWDVEVGSRLVLSWTVIREATASTARTL